MKRVSVSFHRHFSTTTTNYYCNPTLISEQFHLETQPITSSIAPSVCALETAISIPTLLPNTAYRSGSGFFITPSHLITSAQIIATISASKRTAFIGTTTAFRTGTTRLNTKPVAISFSHDVAVLKVVDHPETGLFNFKPVTLGEYVENECVLLRFSRYRDAASFGHGTVRAIGGVGGGVELRADAPWPLDRDLRWIEIDWMRFPGDPRIESDDDDDDDSSVELCGVTGSMGGSPWYNLNGEVVGFDSWEVREGEVGYGVSSVSIKAVVEYAMSKGPEDPIVMDDWIKSTHVCMNHNVE